MNRSRHGLALATTATLALTGLGVLGSTGIAHAATTPDLYVETGGLDTHDCLTVATACLTLQGAITVMAAANNSTNAVTIHVGTGTFTPGVGGALIVAGNPTSLAITGAGVTSTTLKTGTAISAIGLSTAINIGSNYPVSITALSITAQGLAPGGGPGSAPVSGPGSPGQPGGSIVGIQDAGAGDLTVTDVHISGLVGGPGGLGGSSLDDLPGPGGPGGNALGIAVSGGGRNTTISHTLISGLTGGAGRGGGSNDQGGAAGGPGGVAVAVSALTNLGSVSITDSFFTGNLGGAGGNGADTGKTGHAGDGGAGGGAYGVDTQGQTTTVDSVTVSQMRGGAGGAGGSALPPATPGAGAAGGPAIGIHDKQLGDATVANSTVTDQRGGPGGAAGNTGSGTSSVRPPSAAVAGPVTFGGNAGLGIGVQTDSTGTGNPAHRIFHDTITDNSPGIDAANLNPAAPAAFGAGLQVNGSRGTTYLAAAILLNTATGAVNCKVTAGTLTDSGFNAVSDHATPTCGTAATDIAITAAELDPLGIGSLPTIALHPDSPATTAVDGSVAAAAVAANGYCAGLYASDERGLPRPGGTDANRCAAGAFEPQIAAPTGGGGSSSGGSSGNGTITPGPPGGSICIQPGWWERQHHRHHHHGRHRHGRHHHGRHHHHHHHHHRHLRCYD